MIFECVVDPYRDTGEEIQVQSHINSHLERNATHPPDIDENRVETADLQQEKQTVLKSSVTGSCKAGGLLVRVDQAARRFVMQRRLMTRGTLLNFLSGYSSRPAKISLHCKSRFSPSIIAIVIYMHQILHHQLSRLKRHNRCLVDVLDHSFTNWSKHYHTCYGLQAELSGMLSKLTIFSSTRLLMIFMHGTKAKLTD